MQSKDFYNIDSRDGSRKPFRVKHYFYRVKFQARGAPHIHCLFWLEGEDKDDKPPSLWTDDEKSSKNKEDLGNEIARFASSIISGSVNEVCCMYPRTVMVSQYVVVEKGIH